MNQYIQKFNQEMTMQRLYENSEQTKDKFKTCVIASLNQYISDRESKQHFFYDRTKTLTNINLCKYIIKLITENDLYDLLEYLDNNIHFFSRGKSREFLTYISSKLIDLKDKETMHIPHSKDTASVIYIKNEPFFKENTLGKGVFGEVSKFTSESNQEIVLKKRNNQPGAKFNRFMGGVDGEWNLSNEKKFFDLTIELLPLNTRNILINNNDNLISPKVGTNVTKFNFENYNESQLSFFINTGYYMILFMHEKQFRHNDLNNMGNIQVVEEGQSIYCFFIDYGMATDLERRRDITFDYTDFTSILCNYILPYYIKNKNKHMILQGVINFIKNELNIEEAIKDKIINNLF